MYELLILGILRNRDMSGYKLGRVLESSLVPRREISNGVIYPLLNRLAKQGYIEMTENQHEPRNKKMARITELGQQRFQELMMVTVADDAKRESIYRFKFRGMDGVDVATQHQILADYENATQTDLNIYQHVQRHLQARLADNPGDARSIKSGIRAIALSISICQTKQAWINKYKTEMEQEERQNGTEK